MARQNGLTVNGKKEKSKKMGTGGERERKGRDEYGRGEGEDGAG